MKPIKYLPAQKSPYELEMEQAYLEIMSTQGGPKKGWRRIQEAYEALFAEPEPFTIDDIAARVPEVSSNHIRFCLSDEQKQAMRARRSPKAEIDQAFLEMTLEDGPVSMTELARKTGYNVVTLQYHLTPEQQEWIQKRRSWK